jgi:hypothetical protein
MCNLLGERRNSPRGCWQSQDAQKLESRGALALQSRAGTSTSYHRTYSPLSNRKEPPSLYSHQASVV